MLTSTSAGMERKSVSLHPAAIPFKNGVFAWRLRIGNEWHICWTFCDVWRKLHGLRDRPIIGIIERQWQHQH